MNESEAVKKFQRLKVLTIEQLVGLIESSVITARRHCPASVSLLSSPIFFLF